MPALLMMSYTRSDPPNLNKLARRLLGKPSPTPFPSAMLLLAAFAAQPPGIEFADYPSHKAYNRANRATWSRLKAIRTAMQLCRDLGVTNDEIVLASRDRALYLHAYYGGDIDLTFTARPGQEYRLTTAQLLNYAVKIAHSRIKQEKAIAAQQQERSEREAWREECARRMASLTKV